MSTVWPMLLDISKEDCKRFLRCLELEAYAALVSAFRAQGDLTKDKKKVLQELCTILGISMERHRAEVRRVVNDERLATIADVVAGCSDYSEWSLEGRRVVPLMPRLVPQTAFTNIANANAAIAAQQNACLPPPSATKNVKENLPVSPSNSIGNLTMVRTSTKLLPAEDHLLRISPQVTSTSPADIDSFLAQHEVVVSTSLPDEDYNKSLSLLEFPPAVNVEDSLMSCKPSNKRKQTLSDDSAGAISQIIVQEDTTPFGSFTPPAMVSTSASPSLTFSSATAEPPPSPQTVNIPISAGPLQFTLTSSSSTSSPRLSASTTSALSSMYPAQKVFLVSTSSANLPSSILQRSLTVPIVKTVTGTNSSVTVSSQSTGRPTSSSLITPISSSTPVSLVLSSANASSSTLTQSQSGSKSLKIIAQSVPASTAARLGQKLNLGSGMPPIVVVTKTSVGKGCQPGTRLVNVINAQPMAGKNVPSLVALGTKGKQAAFVKVSPGMSLSSATGGKPNVFVVQKSHMFQQLKQAQPVSAFAISASSFSGTQTMLKARSPLNKEGFRLPAVVVPKAKTPVSSSTPATAAPAAAATSSNEASVSRKSSVLADLLQAAGILPDGGSAVVPTTEVASPSYLTDQPTVKSGDEQKEESAIGEDLFSDIATFVEQLKAKETVNVFNQSCFVQSPESIDGQQNSGKPKAKLIKLDSGVLDTKSARFAPFTGSIAIDGSIKVLSAGPVDQPVKRAASLSLEALIQSSLNDVKAVQPPPISVEGSTLRRELMAGRTEFKSLVETLSVPSDRTGPFPPGTRTFLYKGATYSKGDRKKVAEFTTTLEPTDVAPTTSTGTSTSCIESSENVSDVVQFQEEIATLSEQEVQFTDDSLTAVVEETVVTSEDFAPVVNAGVEMDAPNEPVEPASSSEDTNIISLDMPTFVTNEPTPVRLVTTRANTQASSSGSSVFMVSDSLEGALQSPYIIQQGLCGIAGIEGGSETLEIIGSTDDLDSVESRVAALHGEDEISQFHQSFDVASAAMKKKKGNQVMDTGWYRSVIGLLHRVMKFRGPNRFKGEPSAAHWFLHPVSAEDAPGYHKIVINPMDFTTILKKLEKFAYKGINEFHEDMLLVKHNCELYNPDHHKARQDCEHVFTFYQQEYNKLLSKTQLISPLKKRKT